LGGITPAQPAIFGGKMDQATEQMKATVDKIESSLKDTKKESDDITGSNEDYVVASTSGKKYRFFPVSLKHIAELTAKIEKIVKILQNAGNSSNMSDSDAFKLNDGEILKLMSEVISMGLKGVLTSDQVMEEFSLGDFPKCFEKSMDLNDFFTGMRNIYRKRGLIS